MTRTRWLPAHRAWVVPVVLGVALLTLQTEAGAGALRSLGLLSAPSTFAEVYFTDPQRPVRTDPSGGSTLVFDVRARGADADIAWRVDVGDSADGARPSWGSATVSLDETRTFKVALPSLCEDDSDRDRVAVTLEATGQQIVTWVGCDDLRSPT